MGSGRAVLHRVTKLLRPEHQVAGAVGLQGGGGARPGGGVGLVQDDPVTDQASRGVGQACGQRGGCSVGHVRTQSGFQDRSGARCHAVDVLDGFVQRIHAGGGAGGGGDVGHVQHFNVTFAGFVGGVLGRVHTAGAEGSVHAGGQGAGLVRGGQLAQAGVGVLRHSSGPHVAGRQSDLEVVQVVGVTGATETDLDQLAVGGVGVHQADQGGVVTLGGEVREHQLVANTVQVDRQRVSGRAGVDDSGFSHGQRAAGKTHTADSGGNAQSKYAFFHVDSK
eukprot:Amastigsp_a175628_13.p2 type:complete len:278 gc:universal Amastigsp_a175628_13:875-42(-)